MAEMQENAFGSLGIPLCYTLGNHDFDYAEYCFRNGIKETEIPFYDTVRKHPGWHTTENVSDICFSLPFGNDMFWFFSDHAAEDNSWCATHSYFRYGRENYPYTEEDYQKIREEIAASGKRVLTFGHCAMPGGNNHAMMLIMKYGFPIMLVWLTKTYPAALGLYWFISNFLQIFYNLHFNRLRKKLAEKKREEKRNKRKPVRAGQGVR